MGAETKGCAKGLFPLFWGAVVVGLGTFGWVLYNKGALAFLVGGGPQTEAAQVMPVQNMPPQNMQAPVMNPPNAQNQPKITPIGMRWVGGRNGAPMQQGSPGAMTVATRPQVMGVAAGSSMFGNVIRSASQVVVNISAISQLPVGHPQTQGQENAMEQGGIPAAQNQNPAKPIINKANPMPRGAVAKPQPPVADLSFVDPFGGPTVESIGSGAIICPKGHILTNYHVIERASSVFVNTYVDGVQSRHPAVVQKADKALDLAILKIDAGVSLPYATFADSNMVEIGDPVIAIGSPWGLSQTVTQGIVSAKRQTVTIQGVQHANLLQTDASINRGNSGGPLINADGEVVGVNTAIFTTSGAFSGVGFAIPANNAKQFLFDAGVVLPEQVAAQGGIMNANGNMGMNANQNNRMGMNANMPNAQPVLFGFDLGFGGAPKISCSAKMPHPFWGECKDCHVFTDGPCAVNPMDAVMKARGKPAGQPAAFMNVTMMGSGVNKAGAGGMNSFPPVPSNFGVTNFVGLNIQDVNPIAARQFQGEPDRGVLVRTVAMNSPGMKASLLPGDIILKVNGRAITGVKMFHRMVHKSEKGKPIRIFYTRKGVRKETEIMVGAIPSTLNQVFSQPNMGMMGQNNMGMMNNNDDPNRMMGQNNMGMLGQMGALGPMMVNQDRRMGMGANGNMANGNMGVNGNMGNGNMMNANANMGMNANQDNRMGMNGNMVMGQVNINNLNDTNWMGMDLNLLTPRKAMQRGLAANTKGLRVRDVNNNSMAMMAGIQRGDIIKSINNIKILDANSAVQALNAAMMGSKNELEIQRFNMIGLVVLG